MSRKTPASPLTSREERFLVARIQGRDIGWKQLFGQLVDGHVPAIRSRCLAYLQNADDAADATQEVLIRAFRAIDRFRCDASLRTWLFAIADNECHTLRLKRARYQSMPKELESSFETPQTPTATPCQHAEDNSELVQWALQRIGPQNRDVLQLRYFADLSITDVATTLGISLSAAKMRLYRAQEQLADIVAPVQLAQAA